MKKTIPYKNEPLKMKIVKDFLPAPEYLAVKRKNVKVTITLSENSIDFFKNHAKRTHSHYQTMIREIIDYYVTHYS